MKTKKSPEITKTQAASECGVEHSDCTHTFKGTCDREAGHDGSHHCNQCQSMF